MPVTRPEWTSTSSTDVNSAGNWSTGAVPATTDIVRLWDRAKASLTTNPSALSAVTIGGLDVGPNFDASASGSPGSVGTAANPLYFGAMGVEVRINSVSLQSLNFRCTSAPLLVVENTHPNPASVYLTHGTYTSAHIVGGRGTKIGAGVTLTVARIGAESAASGLVATIESGATLTTTHMISGDVRSEAAATTLYLHGGTWEQVGTSTSDITTAWVGEGATLYYDGKSGTITTLEVRPGGTVDFTRTPYAKTITNCIAWHGATIKYHNAITFTNGIIAVGRYAGVASGRVVTPAATP